ncbi:hypothetical protein pb186bvf_018943 [Paramecium bursaria]
MYRGHLIRRHPLSGRYYTTLIKIVKFSTWNGRSPFIIMLLSNTICMLSQQLALLKQSISLLIANPQSSSEQNVNIIIHFFNSSQLNATNFRKYLSNVTTYLSQIDCCIKNRGQGTIFQYNKQKNDNLIKAQYIIRIKQHDYLYNLLKAERIKDNLKIAPSYDFILKIKIISKHNFFQGPQLALSLIVIRFDLRQILRENQLSNIQIQRNPQYNFFQLKLIQQASKQIAHINYIYFEYIFIQRQSMQSRTNQQLQNLSVNQTLIYIILQYNAQIRLSL